MMHDIDDEEQKEVRKLEVIFEKKYREIYHQRDQFINAQIPTDEALVAEFDARAEKMKDADYEKMEV